MNTGTDFQNNDGALRLASCSTSGKTQLINNANKTKTKHAYDKRHHPLSGTYSERPYSSNAVQEATFNSAI